MYPQVSFFSRANVYACTVGICRTDSSGLRYRASLRNLADRSNQETMFLLLMAPGIPATAVSTVAVSVLPQ